MLSLGIPPNALMALASQRHDGARHHPGRDHHQAAALFWGLIASMWLKLMLVVLNLPIDRALGGCCGVPYGYLFPTILILCCIGTYTLNSSTGDVIVTTVFGVIGYAFPQARLRAGPAPAGSRAGADARGNFRRAMVLSNGDWSVVRAASRSASASCCSPVHCCWRLHCRISVAAASRRFLEMSGFASRSGRQSADGGQAAIAPTTMRDALHCRAPSREVIDACRRVLPMDSRPPPRCSKSAARLRQAGASSLWFAQHVGYRDALVWATAAAERHAARHARPDRDQPLSMAAVAGRNGDSRRSANSPRSA